MRTHHGKSAFANWNWESNPESTAHFRRWAKLHIRLYPYLRGLAELALSKGLPLMRPMALQQPDFEPGWTVTDQFMLGDRLYVAPVVTEGATSRSLDLPPGSYYPLQGGEALEVTAGDRPTVEAALEDVPVFVPAGSILVLLPESIDSLAPRHPDSGVVSLDDVEDDRHLWLYPGGESAWSESGLDYAWQAVSGLGREEARWNGEAANWQGDTLTVMGNGVLEIGEGGRGRLEVSGGSQERVLQITLR